MRKPLVAQRPPPFGPSLATPDEMPSYYQLDELEYHQLHLFLKPVHVNFGQVSVVWLLNNILIMVVGVMVVMMLVVMIMLVVIMTNFVHLFLSRRLPTQVITSQTFPSEVHLHIF